MIDEGDRVAGVDPHGCKATHLGGGGIEGRANRAPHEAVTFDVAGVTGCDVFSSKERGMFTSTRVRPNRGERGGAAFRNVCDDTPLKSSPAQPILNRCDAGFNAPVTIG